MNINQRKIYGNILVLLILFSPLFLPAQEYIKGEPAAVVIDKQKLKEILYKLNDKSFRFYLVNIQSADDRNGMLKVLGNYKGVKKASIGKMNKEGLRLVKISATAEFGIYAFRKMLLEASINILYIDGVPKDVHYLRVKDPVNPFD